MAVMISNWSAPKGSISPKLPRKKWSWGFSFRAILSNPSLRSRPKYAPGLTFCLSRNLRRRAFPHPRSSTRDPSFMSGRSNSNSGQPAWRLWEKSLAKVSYWDIVLNLLLLCSPI